MNCKWCNTHNQENNKFCMNCGKELNNNDNINNYQQENNNNNLYQTNNQLPKQEEKANIGLAILSFFIPLVGLILFIVKKNKEPKTAKACGICALISFIISFVLTVILIISVLTIGNIINESKDNYNNFNNHYNNIDNNYNDVDEFENNTNQNNNDNTNNVSTTNNWQKYEITINNTKIILPVAYNDLKKATNASMKSADEKSYLSSNTYTIANMYKSDKLALYIDLTNKSNDDLLYTECQVTRVSQTEYQVSNDAEIIIFPGGLKAGDKITESEIINLFGTPYDTYEYSNNGYEKKIYKYAENTTWPTTNNYEITVVNGIIDELQLDKRN